MALLFFFSFDKTHKTSENCSYMILFQYKFVILYFWSALIICHKTEYYQEYIRLPQAGVCL